MSLIVGSPVSALTYFTIVHMPQLIRMASHLLYGQTDIVQNALHHSITLRMYGGIVKRILPATDAEKPCCLFERLRTKLRHRAQVPPGS